MTRGLLILVLVISTTANAYESIPLSPVQPFHAASCGPPPTNDLVWYTPNTPDTRTAWAQNPGPAGNDPMTYNGGAGLENLFWNKWATHVFRIIGRQGLPHQQVPLEVVTNLSWGTASGDLAEAGLTALQISTLRSTGRVNPAGEANFVFTGAWVRNQGWALPLQRPATTAPGGDCIAGACHGRWTLENTLFDLDGPDTALYLPAPVNAAAWRWMVKESVLTRPIRQSLVIYPYSYNAEGKGLGGVVFAADDTTDTKLVKLKNVPYPSNTTGTWAVIANGFEEMIRFLGNQASYNWPGQTYCSGSFPCSPLRNPGSANSSFNVVLLGQELPEQDCRVPNKSSVTPYSGTVEDYDRDGGYDPLFPDFNVGGNCVEQDPSCNATSSCPNFLADDMAYKLRTLYPWSSIGVMYLGKGSVYGSDPSACDGSDRTCQYYQRIAAAKPPETSGNYSYIISRWGGVETAVNDLLSSQPVLTIPSFTGSCSTFVATTSDWLVSLTHMASYTSKLYKLNPNTSQQLTIPPAPENVAWEFGSILRDADKSSLKIETTLNGITAVDFRPTTSILVGDLSSDDPYDPNDPDWSTAWTVSQIPDAIRYIRGQNVSGMRQREFPEGSGSVSPWPLGEIFTEPVVIGPPRSGLSECFLDSADKKQCYSDFEKNNKNRTKMVAVSTGDGQLRILNYNTGQQLYSFVPKAALQTLRDYAKPGYARKSFVVGPIQAFDVYDDGSQNWKTVLIAGMAQGGASYFALDITDPADIKFMWEVSRPVLGNTFSPVVSARVKDPTHGEKFVFVAGSGYNNLIESAGSTAYLAVISLSGQVVREIKVSDVLGNGVTSVYANDVNDDGIMDAVIAGTYKGELVKVTTPSTNYASWGVERKLADFGRPITAPVRTSRIESQQYVYGTTGKLLVESDLTESPAPQEYFFAFRDTGTTVGLNDLTTYDATLQEYDDRDDATRNYRYATLATSEQPNKTGYKIAFPAGHRGTNPVLTVADGVIFSTVDPVRDTQCTYGGRSLAWHVNQKLNPVFADANGDDLPNIDVNGDGVIDAADNFDGVYPSARETVSMTFRPNPQIDMGKQTIDLVTVELYGDQLASDGRYYATVGHTSIRNRMRGTSVNWTESKTIKK